MKNEFIQYYDFCMKFRILISVLILLTSTNLVFSTVPPLSVTSLGTQVKEITNSFAEWLSHPTAQYSEIFKEAFFNYRRKAVNSKLEYSNNTFDSFAYEFAALFVSRLYGETTDSFDLVQYLVSQETSLLKDVINRLLEDQNLCKELVSFYGKLFNLRGKYIDDFQLKVIVGALKNSNMLIIDLGDNDFTDISPLASITSIKKLNLSNSPREVRKNRIVDFSPLASLVNLQLLNLANNQIDDISSLCMVLGSLPNLLNLNLSNNQIVDISPLAFLYNLNILSLIYNHVVDISSLASLLKLKILHLDNNPISSIAPLASLRNLEFLFLDDIGITDISPVASLSELVALYLHNNRIIDISPLFGLTKIFSLHLGNNQITDISPLASLRELKYLYLNNNLIVDFSILDSLRSFSDLKTEGNQVDYVHPSRRI